MLSSQHCVLVIDALSNTSIQFVSYCQYWDCLFCLSILPTCTLVVGLICVLSSYCVYHYYFAFSIRFHVCINFVMGTCIVIACSHHIESVDLMACGITIETSSRAPLFVSILKTIHQTVCPQEPLWTDTRAHTYICILYYIERHWYYLRICLLLYFLVQFILKRQYWFTEVCLVPYCIQDIRKEPKRLDIF